MQNQRLWPFFQAGTVLLEAALYSLLQLCNIHLFVTGRKQPDFSENSLSAGTFQMLN